MCTDFWWGGTKLFPHVRQRLQQLLMNSQGVLWRFPAYSTGWDGSISHRWRCQERSISAISSVCSDHLSCGSLPPDSLLREGFVTATRPLPGKNICRKSKSVSPEPWGHHFTPMWREAAWSNQAFHQLPNVRSKKKRVFLYKHLREQKFISRSLTAAGAQKGTGSFPAISAKEQPRQDNVYSLPFAAHRLEFLAKKRISSGIPGKKLV